MHWIDQKYIGALAPKLQMFARKSDNVWNMRCPICGDSRKSKTKARGYILGKQGSYIYTCHNCHVSMPFSKFLESVDPTAYQDYLIERFTERKIGSKFDTSKIVQPANDISRFITPKFIKFTAFKDLKKVSQLSIDHPLKKYIERRKIPSKFHGRLFFAPKFKMWTNTLKPDKFDLTKPDEPRLVIPFIDKQGNVFAYQGRALLDVEPKYITIVLNEELPRVFGLDTVNLTERVYVVEGPIDSMFLRNSLAMAGSHLDHSISSIGLKPSNTTVVYDNEPRNPHIIKAMNKVVDQGFSICVWPSDHPYKDLNESIMNGMDIKKLQDLIDCHTYKDLVAKLMINKWKRIA